MSQNGGSIGTESHILRVPGDGADCSPPQVAQGKGLSLRLYIPYCHKPTAATSGKNVGDFLIPVDRIQVVCS